MGTRCQVLVVMPTGANAAAAAVSAWSGIEMFDALWSRFRADSELSELNRAASQGSGDVTTTVGPFTATLVAAMAWAYRYSDALVDAAVLDRVIAAGYDADFDEVESRGARASVSAGRPAHAASVADVHLVGNRVRRPAGTQLDSGGVGKGLAADLLVESVAATGAAGVLVDLGGDIRAVGVDLDGRPWRIGIADERAALSPGRTSGAYLAEWSTHDGAVATSSTARRRWNGGHHLIDPRTGLPATSDLLSVSVSAENALTAETCAKTALIQGLATAQAWLPGRVRQALLTDTNGHIHHIDGTATAVHDS